VLGLSAATALAVALSGCGGGSDLPSSTNSSSGAANGPDLKGQTIEVVASWSGTEQKNFQAALDAFAKKTGAKVNYTSGGDDVATLVTSRLAGGAPPDVALIAQPGVINDFAKKGQIKPLSGAAADAVKANYSDAWQKLATIDGKLYGLYFKVANKSVVWYRTDKFDEAGVKPPTTWEEFTKVSQTLADAGITPIAVPGGDGWTLTDWFENIYLRVAGADNYEKLSKHQIPWTDKTVVDSLKVLGDYWKTAKFVQGGNTGALQVSFTQSIADVFGSAPKSAMLYEGDFVGSEITKLGKTKVGEGAKFFDFPSVNGSKPAVVTAGDQAVAFKDTPGATALIAYLASPEAAKLVAANGGFLSANKNLDPSAYPDPITKQLGLAVVNAQELRFDMSDLTPTAFGGSSTASMWKLLQDFLRSPNDPAGTAQKLETAAVKDFGSK
jgi:ABC-type glycerol-3-phosphate transport system substrate-binding protein